MFGIIRKRRPIIPTREPEQMDPTNPEMEPANSDSASTSPAEAPVAESSKETLETPPLTPTSETAGDGSTDEPSAEDPTVKEASKILAIIAKANAIKNDETPGFNDETPDLTEDGMSESEDENDDMNPFSNKLYKAWFSFWIITLAVGVFAYYVHTHQIIIASRSAYDSDEINLLLVSREKWDDTTDVMAKPSSYMAQRVVVLQTDTESCHTTTTCAKLLNKMKRQHGPLKYNFLLATDGCIYEALGWQEPSPLYPDVATMVVALIGNYQKLAPSTMQLSQLQSLLEASVELKYLSSSYTVLGRKVHLMPSKLFAFLAGFRNWDKENSDIDDQSSDMDVEFEPFPMFDH